MQSARLRVRAFLSRPTSAALPLKPHTPKICGLGPAVGLEFGA